MVNVQLCHSDVASYHILCIPAVIHDWYMHDNGDLLPGDFFAGDFFFRSTPLKEFKARLLLGSFCGLPFLAPLLQPKPELCF
jgi:hypothetical protein